MHLQLVTVLVADYDAAIAFYVDGLGFELVEDTAAQTGDGRPKRWVVVRPPGARTGLLLARADGDRQEAAVGEQFAGRVGLFLRVGDLDAARARLVAAGATSPTEPRDEPYGRVAVFEDPGGNRWDLLADAGADAPVLPTTLALPGPQTTLRRATLADVPAIVALLADDDLGRSRETTDERPYRGAFAAIDADAAHLLLVATVTGDVAGTLQLSCVPGLARGGALRAHVEAVRVAAEHRGGGLGEAMITWVLAEARRRGCALVQLTSDKTRTDAHRFYARLGFVASHEGFKLEL